MLRNTLTVNIGEDKAIYVEVYDINTPTDQLVYGDTRFQEVQNPSNPDEKITTSQIWYGETEGWVDTIANTNSVTDGIARWSIGQEENPNAIVRILNNQPDFDKESYLKSKGETHE